MKKVMVFGTFDVLHPGHEFLLREAKKYGDYLIVIVGRDSTTLELKKHPPQYNEQERVNHLKSLGIADEVLLGKEGDKHQIIRDHKPDVVAVGYDQKFFLDDLEDSLKSDAIIVKIPPFMPEIYKSSKLKH